MSENMKKVQTAIDAMNRINLAVRAYEEGKVTLFNGMDVPFSAEQIQALKADFVASKAALIAALNGITA